MKDVIRKLSTGVFAFGLFVFLSAAHAADNAEGPRWACWYDGEQAVRCLLARSHITDTEARAAAVSQRFDPRLPELVRTIWGSPEQLAGKNIHIPLFTDPYEMDFVRQLAEAVMCGVRKDCSVVFDPNADGRARVRAAALKAGVDEEVVMAEMRSQGFGLQTAMVAAAAEAPATKPSRRRRALS